MSTEMIRCRRTKQTNMNPNKNRMVRKNLSMRVLFDLLKIEYQTENSRNFTGH